MLSISLGILAFAGLIGAILAAFVLRSERRRRLQGGVAAVHGAIALVGLGFLLAGLKEPPRSEAAGTGSFAIFAALLFVLAVLLGLAMLAGHLTRRRFASRLIGVHATAAITGLAFLAAYVLVR